MRLLFQKCLRSSTRSIRNGKISAEAVLLTTDVELVARIVIAQDTFLIEKAEWESLRSGSHYMPNGDTATQLTGSQAYFGVAASLARAFPDEKQRHQRALFAECIKAVIQSECYLFLHRGYADKKTYQEDWDSSHPNSCRYYSHLDLVERRWFGYIGDETRSRSLFHRNKNVAVWLSDAGDLQTTASFLDSFHELGIQAECTADGQILDFNGCFLRAPDSICFGTTDLLAALPGRNIHGITRKELNRCLGGSEGCSHLLDLGQDLLNELKNQSICLTEPNHKGYNN